MKVLGTPKAKGLRRANWFAMAFFAAASWQSSETLRGEREFILAAVKKSGILPARSQHISTLCTTSSRRCSTRKPWWSGFTQFDCGATHDIATQETARPRRTRALGGHCRRDPGPPEGARGRHSPRLDHLDRRAAAAPSGRGASRARAAASRSPTAARGLRTLGVLVADKVSGA